MKTWNDKKVALRNWIYKKIKLKVYSYVYTEKVKKVKTNFKYHGVYFMYQLMEYKRFGRWLDK